MYSVGGCKKRAIINSGWTMPWMQIKHGPPDIVGCVKESKSESVAGP